MLQAFDDVVLALLQQHNRPIDAFTVAEKLHWELRGEAIKSALQTLSQAGHITCIGVGQYTQPLYAVCSPAELTQEQIQVVDLAIADLKSRGVMVLTGNVCECLSTAKSADIPYFALQKYVERVAS